MSDWDAQAVRARLRAKTFRYELRPPLPEAEVRAFEEEHGFRLPEEYRTFVTTVGDGPAGPRHGLMPLITPRPEADDDWAVDDEWRDDRRPGRLAAPCPIRTPRPYDENRRYDEAEGLTLGTLMLAEEGCGIYLRLILGGPLAGQVWHLDQEFGCHTLESPDFRTWYTDWLEQ
ncbi:SMI1/KNR4 family protein [Streptomyces erythrochromogenes]|uniref:SMI1/KNR4 family protein n=1 Tax=Streptomyces erythrochromogenes TaxID=285574 RepID=UPI00369B94CF